MFLHDIPGGNLPTEQKEAVTAKRAPVWMEQPKESRFDRVSGAHTSKIDRSAMGAARREEPESGVDHAPVSIFAGISAVVTATFEGVAE
jgi:hypothetical protein